MEKYSNYLQSPSFKLLSQQELEWMMEAHPITQQHSGLNLLIVNPAS